MGNGNPSAAAAPGTLGEARGIRIALAVAAAPILCGLAGLVVLMLLRHRQATLLDHYAALHLTPWPGPAGWEGEPSSFLHGIVAGREILVRNPAQWAMDIGMTSFAGVPVLLIAGASIAYGVVARTRTAIVAALPAFIGMAWYCWAPVGMLLLGHEVVLDPVTDHLTINGTTVAALSDIASFIGRTTHRTKGGDDFHLEALTRSGRVIALGGPDDRPDLVDAAIPLQASLRRWREGQ